MKDDTTTISIHPLLSFTFEGFNIRIDLDDNGEPWFCASDASAVLGFANSRDAVSRHCRAKGVGKRDTLTDGGTQSLTFITEGNLYRLTANSSKPEAERFEEWVFDEVIPSIRKRGFYGELSFKDMVAVNREVDALLVLLETTRTAALFKERVFAIESLCQRAGRPLPDIMMLKTDVEQLRLPFFTEEKGE